VTDRPAASTPPVAEPVLVRREGAVLTVTINRPHRKNALDIEAFSGLHRAFDAASRDESVRVVVLTGAGGDFCAGADLAVLEQEGHPLHRMRWVGEIIETLHHLPQPTIAKVEGVAVGGGCNLALACDLVVARSDARFSEIFARRGLSVDMGGSWVLPRLVGLQQAKRLAFLGEIIGAEEALEVGLATWVRTPEEIDDFVADLAGRLAAGPPIALAQSKALLNEASSQTLREALEGEARAQLVNFATDLPAAQQAFLDKTEPVFGGTWQA
jgi:2-(1,2-epoxy-1,2-dihydrophenyl)acetyl-CoA isomerase